MLAAPAHSVANLTVSADRASVHDQGRRLGLDVHADDRETDMALDARGRSGEVFGITLLAFAVVGILLLLVGLLSPERRRHAVIEVWNVS